MDEIAKAELELIRLKVRRSIDAADRGEARAFTDAVIEDVLADAAKRHATRNQDLIP